MRRITPHIALLLLLGLLVGGSCKKKEAVTRKYADINNPYDTDGAGDDGALPDSATIEGVHRFILEPGCAKAGCHDGHFEPDFRTIHSSYSTLVYHPLIKNNASNDFRFRVVPYDTAASVFYERIVNCCFVNQNDQMPQDRQEPLAPENVKVIAAWIMDGARDMQGKVPEFTSPRPFLYNNFNMLAFIGEAWPDTNMVSNNREDGFLSPFIVPQDTMIEIWFDVRDIRIAGDTVLGNDPSLSNPTIKFSSQRNDYTGATTDNLQVAATPLNIGVPVNNLHFYLYYQLQTGAYAPGEVVFFRIYVTDEDNVKPAEIFHSKGPLFLHDFFAIKIEP